ncbi:MAG: molecular chaperone HtpG [Bacteroidota bacterium]|nr:molecular chaperone HtpG [Bacteroidota bacterium]
MPTGTLQVNLSGLLPIIRRYLYTHTDVFLRELIANGVDACQKLLAIAPQEGLSISPDELKVEIFAYPAKNQLVIKDNGIGMTQEEVERFLNVIAASSAREFAEKFRETDIIGFFGMGFYSAFMVAEKVEVLTQSYRSDAKAVLWRGDGSENYEWELSERPEGRGTTITLYLHKDYDEYAQVWKVREVAEKYARFLPISIYVEGSRINQVPLWRKHPTDLTEADYLKFYELLYPGREKPAFYIHLNIDYPFVLQGILYFPRLKPDLPIEKSGIQLYVKGMFITDELRDVLPEHLMLLQGVMESNEIPLNVSRSQLQVDPTVRKISQYISRKVAEKIKELYDTNRARYEEIWPDVGPFVRYGMVREEEFYRRLREAVLVETTKGKYYTLNEFRAKAPKDEKGTPILLYTNQPPLHGALIALFEQAGYEVLKMDMIVDPYWMSQVEVKEGVRFARVDSEKAQALLEKPAEASLSLEEEKAIREVLERLWGGSSIAFRSLGEKGPAALLIAPEDDRRYRELLGEHRPTQKTLIINRDHPIYRRYLLSQDERWLAHAIDWAKLLSGTLQDEEIATFLERDWSLLSQ